MSVRGTIDTSTPASNNQGTTNQTYSGAPLSAPGPGASSGPVSIFTMMSEFAAGQSLGPDIEAYIETLRKYVTTDNNGVVSGQITIHRLSDPLGAHLFRCGKYGILMIFESVLLRDITNPYPISDQMGRAFNNDTKKLFQFPDVEPLLFVVVTPADYVKVKQMGFLIKSTLAAYNNPMTHESTISMMLGGEFYINTDMSVVNNFVAENSPHTVLPRMDYGFVLYGREEKKSQSYNWNSDRMADMRPIAAVGGYTEIIKLGGDDFTSGMGIQNRHNFAAYIHITAIAAPMPFPGIVPMCLTMAANEFITNQRWIQPFLSYAPRKPNLGQLSPNPEKKNELWFASNPALLKEWYDANMVAWPMMVVDVVEGQWRIPTIAYFGNSVYYDSVQDMIERFFAGQIRLDRTNPPFKDVGTSYIGVIGDPTGVQHDSRDIDYLNLVAATGAQDEGSAALLRYHQDPIVRARVTMEKSSGSFRPLWRCRLAEINQNVLKLVAQAIINNRVKILNTSKGVDRVVSTDWVVQAAAAYQGTSFSIATPGGAPPGSAGGANITYAL